MRSAMHDCVCVCVYVCACVCVRGYSITVYMHMSGHICGKGRHICDMGVCVGVQVWFEVSGHTRRLHFHTAWDGSRPSGGRSLPMATLQGTAPSASLEALECRYLARIITTVHT